MDIAEVYKLHLSGQFQQLTLDDVLITTGFTHQQLRQHLKKSGHLPLPPLSPGLIAEVRDADERSRTDLVKQFNLSYLQVNTCIYAVKSSRSNVIKTAKAQQLRSTGTTEAEIRAMGLPADLNLVADEVTEQRAAGATVEDLSAKYGYTTARISQLDRNSKPRPRLTAEQKLLIKASDKTAPELAKEFNTTRNTIYVIQRER